MSIEKRRHIRTIYILSQANLKIEMTPYIVRHLMLGGSLDLKFMRKLKMQKICSK